MNEHWRYDECSVAFYHEGIETDMYKVVDALNAAEFRIAELEGLVDKLIEVGDELADDREYQDDLVDIWHDVTRGLKERER